jgi:peptide deformylase
MKENKIQPIVGYGSPILREVCVEVDDTIDKVELLANDILATMGSIDTAVGLAAPQVNVNLRMFAMRLGNKNIIVINPIIKKVRGSVKSPEACLSIPGVNAEVPVRNDIIDVEFFDEKMKKHKLRLRGFEAIIFQHELDHLNGILFTDLLTKEGQEAVNDKLSDMAKGIFRATMYEIILPGTDIVLPKKKEKKVEPQEFLTYTKTLNQIIEEGGAIPFRRFD